METLYADNQGRVSNDLERLILLEGKKLCPDAESGCPGYKDAYLFVDVCSGNYAHCGAHYLRHRNDKTIHLKLNKAMNLENENCKEKN